jgi:hypothetical protein
MVSDSVIKPIGGTHYPRSTGEFRYRELIARPERLPTPRTPPGVRRNHPVSVERPPADRPWRTPSAATLSSVDECSDIPGEPYVGQLDTPVRANAARSGLVGPPRLWAPATAAGANSHTPR